MFQSVGPTFTISCPQQRPFQMWVMTSPGATLMPSGGQPVGTLRLLLGPYAMSCACAGISLGFKSVPDKYWLRVTRHSHDITASASKAADGWLTAWRFAALLALLIGVSFPEVLAGL